MRHRQASDLFAGNTSFLNKEIILLSSIPMVYSKVPTTTTASTTPSPYLAQAASLQDEQSRIRNAFAALDHDRDGYIDTRDLLNVYSKTFYGKEGLFIDEAIVNALIDLASTPSPTASPTSPSSNNISFEQFRQLINTYNINILPLSTDLAQSQKSLEALLSDLVNLGQKKETLAKQQLVMSEQQEAGNSRPTLLTWQYWSSRFSLTAVKHLIAGGVAGAVSRTVVSPLERMKILFQVQGPGNTSYHGIIPTLKKMWQEEGLVGFLRGNGTNVIRIVPYSATQFAAYEKYKRLLLEEGKEELDAKRRLTAGALAGITSVTCTYPLDLVRTRLSVQSGTIGRREVQKMLPGIWTTMKHIYKTEGGLFALYRGLSPTLVGVAPYVGLNFHAYEVLRKYFTPADRTSPPVSQKLLCGAMAGTFAQTVTYPLDVLRRRMQVTGMDRMGYKYKNTWHAVQCVMVEEGFKGFYKGMIPNYLKVAPAIGVSFVTYEACKDLLGVR